MWVAVKRGSTVLWSIISILLLAGYPIKTNIKTNIIVRDLSFHADYKRFSFTTSENCENCPCARGKQMYRAEVVDQWSGLSPEWAQTTNRTVNIPSSTYQNEKFVTKVFSTGANGFFCSNLSYVFRVEPNGEYNYNETI